MKDLKHKSKFLSLVLRHKPETIGITMDANGWVNVDELIEKCNRNNFPLDFSLLEEIVENNDKKRFSFSEDLLKIRANQGHSVEIDLALAPKEAPALLYHGTVEKFLESINQQGLKKMERQHVHLSKDLQTAQKVGSRRGKPVILKINAQQMQADGYVFYQSDNGVWLCEEVPAKYIEFPLNVTKKEAFLYTIEGFLTNEECKDYIQWSEMKGFEAAKIDINGKQVSAEHVRNNSRITFVNYDLANIFWEKFKPYSIEKFANSVVLGLNEMFRFYKYEPGQKFLKHIDGSYVRNETEASFFTLLIYLNDDFEGGQTKFQTHTIQPKAGNALVFYHGMQHSGEEVKNGTKYVLRTDVMYKLIQ